MPTILKNTVGAGASYEVGMPLVWEFTNTLRVNVLKRIDSKLFNFESDGNLRKKLEALLLDENMHYEEVVGELEKIYVSTNKASAPINNVLFQLVECIQLLLLEEQMNTLTFLSHKVKDYYGIKKLIEDQGVIDVYSLNHDIVFEELCDFYEVPYKDGFSESKTNFSNIANFKSISSSQLEHQNLNFFSQGEKGFNLIKLHGSFDIFAAEDKQIFLKCQGDGAKVGSHFNEIRKVEDCGLEAMHRDGVRTTNEICVYDSSNTLQFLRRSLLTGSHKFKGRFEQIAPVGLFNLFKQRISNVDHLYVIGYGFGDTHVNEVLKNWMSSGKGVATIYDPYRSDIPNFLSSYSDRVKIVNGGLSEFFLTFDASEETLMRKVKRKTYELARTKLQNRRENS